MVRQVGTVLRAALGALGILGQPVPGVHAADILTNRNDNARSGATLDEVVLI
jgi:hypothetical protein